MSASTLTDYSGRDDLTVVRIRDEATRRALMSVCWAVVSWRASRNDDLRDVAGEAADDAARIRDEDCAEAIEVLGKLLEAADAVDTVRSAPVGAVVELPLAIEEWTGGIEQVCLSIDEWPDLAAQPPDHQEAVFMIRAAAVRLLSELDLPGGIDA